MTREQRLAYLRDLEANPILMEILEGMEQAALREWDGTATAQVEEREIAWRRRQMVKEFRNRITAILHEENNT